MAVLNYVESKLKNEDAKYSHVINSGDGWLHQIHAGETFRIVDLKGNQAVDAIFYSAADPTERFSAMDTISNQANLFISTGTQLMSTESNVMLEITADTCGRHDCLGGACAAESNTVRYALEKRFMHNCRDTYLKQFAHSELAQNHNLTKRDLTHNINFL